MWRLACTTCLSLGLGRALSKLSGALQTWDMCASRPLFYSTRREHFPKLHQPKGCEWNRCAVCAEFAQKHRQLGAKTPHELLEQPEKEKQHVEIERAQRAVVDREVLRAKEHPEFLLMLMVDQSLTVGIPRLQSLNRFHHLRLHEGGTLLPSKQTGAVFYSLRNEKGPNLILTQMHLQLLEALTSSHLASLAQTVRLVFDFSSGENRNRYTLGSDVEVVEEEKGDGGWQRGRIAQNGMIQQSDGRVPLRLRVFTGSEPQGG